MDHELIAPGAELEVINVEEPTRAELEDHRHVNVRGTKKTINQWAQDETGWTSVNIYDWVRDVDKKKTLGDLRERLQAESE